MPTDLFTTTYRKIKSDDMYMISARKEVVSGGTLNVHVKNPADSDVNLWLVDIHVSGAGSFEQTMYDSFDSAPSGGSSLTIHSILLDEDNTDNNGVAVVNQDVSYTPDNGGHTADIVGGGGSTNQIGGATDHPAVVMEPSRETVVSVENITASSHRYSIRVMYYEAPTGTTNSE